MANRIEGGKQYSKAMVADDGLLSEKRRHRRFSTATTNNDPSSSASSLSPSSDSDEVVGGGERRRREADGDASSPDGLEMLCCDGGGGNCSSSGNTTTTTGQKDAHGSSSSLFHRPKWRWRFKRRRRCCCPAFRPNLTVIVFCSFAIVFLLMIMAAFFLTPVTYYGSDLIRTSEANAPSHYNSTRAHSILDALCSEWHRGRYSGDFCFELCSTPYNWTLVDYIRGGNKHVFKLKGGRDAKEIILKMQHPYAQDYDQQVEFGAVDEDTFADMLLELVNNHLRLGWPPRYKHHLLRRLWWHNTAPTTRNGTDDERRPLVLSEADKRSLWALVQQDEFINTAMLQMSRVIPKLLGVCGHAYRVEYVIAFRMKPYYLNLKAKILVHLMGTLKLFDEFLNEPFQWCDVKFDNLGLSADYPKRFVVMDSDLLFTETKLDTMLRAQRCTNDSECGIFDCAARCDRATGHCTGRTNDNIDVFCKKLIVAQLFGSYWSKSNRYLSACHAQPANITKRLDELRLVWAWTLSDI